MTKPQSKTDAASQKTIMNGLCNKFVTSATIVSQKESHRVDRAAVWARYESVRGIG